jgi:drug/metabolite transporter (DMT)-like permease
MFLWMSKKTGLIDIHTAVLLFGLAGLFGKWLPLSPLFIVLGRVFFASLALALILLISRQGFAITPPKTYLILLFLGFMLSVHWVSFFQSIQVSSVAIGLLSYSTFPVFTTFLEPLFFRERLVKINVLFSLLCLFGVLLIIPSFHIDNATFRGVLWGLLAGFTFSILTIFNRKLTQKLSPLSIAFFQDFFATIFLCPFLFLLKPSLSSRDILLLIILGTVCTAGSHTLFIKGMRHIKAQTASIISSLEPVYGILFAFLFLNEIPSLRTTAGGCVILVSQILIFIKIFSLDHSNRMSVTGE